uniref:Phosphatidylinositol 5-phosphate 4-kinase type-2 gamma n=1 Tax=Myotis lucifugus TaxID=59463 RepID=G1QB23_MYOLU
MASSSALFAIVPATTATPSPGFCFTSKTKKHFMQQKVKMFVFLWSVTYSINEFSKMPSPVMLLPDDFKARKIKVNNYLFHRENLPNCKFKEYCPKVFRKLHDQFGIDDQDYMIFLTRSPPSENEGSDGHFLIGFEKILVNKEVSSRDFADMHSSLSNYYQYIVKCHGNMLLPSSWGCTVSMNNEDNYMLVMCNMFSHRLPMHRKCDLKGSLVLLEMPRRKQL